MGHHLFDPSKIERLEDPTRFRFCSREELLQHLPRGDDSLLLDVGSGSGFYTEELAPFVGQIVGLDVQSVMHERYRERGVAGNVSLVTGEAERLPFPDGVVDGVVSTMTFHESTTDRSLAELYRVSGEETKIAIVDWSAEGTGNAGPPLEERYDSSQARRMLAGAGFTVLTAAERTETFLVVATRQ